MEEIVPCCPFCGEDLPDVVIVQRCIWCKKHLGRLVEPYQNTGIAAYDPAPSMRIDSDILRWRSRTLQ